MNPEQRMLLTATVAMASVSSEDMDALTIEHAPDAMPAERFDRTYYEGGASSWSRQARRHGKAKKRKLFRA